jgi:hypothetical protein
MVEKFWLYEFRNQLLYWLETDDRATLMFNAMKVSLILSLFLSMYYTPL